MESAYLGTEADRRRLWLTGASPSTCSGWARREPGAVQAYSPTDTWSLLEHLRKLALGGSFFEQIFPTIMAG